MGAFMLMNFPQPINTNAAQSVNPGLNGFVRQQLSQQVGDFYRTTEFFLGLSGNVNRNSVFFFYVDPGVGEGVIVSEGCNVTSAEAGNYLVN